MNRLKSALAICAALGGSAASAAPPAESADPAAQIATASASPAPVEPERLRLARQTIDFVWPLGTYKRLMSGAMDQMMNQMMGSIFDTKLKDMVDPGSKEMSAEERKVAETTMREAIASKDPHFEERLRITNRVMMEEIGTIMTKVEPAVREALATVYARKFTSAQLQDLNSFFATPTGRFYASESMMLFMDPELMKSMMTMMPEFLKAMPAIQQKLKKATAHLPEPPKENEEEDEAKEAQDSTT
jgi:hypothetical protein